MTTYCAVFSIEGGVFDIMPLLRTYSGWAALPLHTSAQTFTKCGLHAAHPVCKRKLKSQPSGCAFTTDISRTIKRKTKTLHAKNTRTNRKNSTHAKENPHVHRGKWLTVFWLCSIAQKLVDLFFYIFTERIRWMTHQSGVQQTRFDSVRWDSGNRGDQLPCSYHLVQSYKGHDPAGR